MNKTHPMLLLSTKKAILMDRAVKSKLLSTKQEVLVDRNGNIKRIYMKNDFSALSFSEKERICESIFINNGPYWHLYTDGTKMQNLFFNQEEVNTGMWSLAASLHLCKSVRSLTFELMTNHIHLLWLAKRKNA